MRPESETRPSGDPTADSEDDPRTAAPVAAAAIVVRLLGPLEITDGAGSSVAVHRLASRRLLALVVLNAGRWLTREHVAFTLWPDVAERTALEQLRQALYWLAHDLPPDAADGAWIETDGRSAITWHGPGSWVDVQAFDRAVDAARDEADPTAARRVLEAAIALYQGDLLAGWDEGWLSVDRHHLSQRLEAALEQLAVVCALTGDTAAAVDAALRRRERAETDALSDRLLARMFAVDGRIDPARDMIASWRARLDTRAAIGIAAEVDAAERWLEVQPRPRTGGGRGVPFLGRTVEIAAALAQLGNQPVLTITGEAGVGKSQLGAAVGNAMWATTDVVPTYLSYGTYLPSDDPWPALAALLVAEVDALDAPALVDALQADGRPHLIVIDDADPQIEAVAAFAHQVAMRADLVRLIVTCRAPLRIEGEAVLRLSALEPSAAERLVAAATEDRLGDADRVRLAAAVERVPLALLLAADAWATTDPPVLFALLDHTPHRLAGRPPTQLGRHRSLAAAHAWGWARLSAAAQQMLVTIAERQRAAGYATPGDVAAGADDDAATVADLRALVDGSLVVARIGTAGTVGAGRTVETVRTGAAEESVDVVYRLPRALASFVAAGGR